MQPVKRCCLFCALISLTILLAACGDSPATSTPATTAAITTTAAATTTASPTATPTTAAPTATPRPTDTPQPPTATPAPPTATPTPKVAKVGETVTGTNYTLVINSVEEGSDNKFYTPKAGNKFLSLNVTITATQKADYNPFAAKIKDSEGYEYSSTIAVKDPALHSGTLAKGDKVRGWISFELPKAATSLVFTYNMFEDNGGVSVALS